MPELERKHLKKVLALFNDCVFLSNETVKHPQFSRLIEISTTYVSDYNNFDKNSETLAREFITINNRLRDSNFYRYLNNEVLGQSLEWFEENPLIVLQLPDFFPQEQFFSAPHRIKKYVEREVKKLSCFNYSEDYLLQKKQELIERGEYV